jgi:hypothetical protein
MLQGEYVVMITRKELTTQRFPLIGPKQIVLIFFLAALTICSTIIFDTSMHRQFLVATTTSSNGVAQQKTTTKNLTSTAAYNASKVLIRIDQNSFDQYNNQLPHDTWSPSACSAASMVEEFNAYGHHYKIADVLQVEAGIGAITPDLGLFSPDGIDQTAAKFGFSTTTLTNPTVDQVLQKANDGTPPIINFPPPAAGGHWPGGHFLVVLVGVTINGVRYVHLADSSLLNMQYMKVGSVDQKGTFLYYWRGLAKVITPIATNTGYSVLGKPTITAAFINQVLAAYHSPAAGQGQALYDLGVQYGIDPAFALAFFMHESTFGTAGEARITLALGNLRCIPNYLCVNTSGTACQTGQSCYAKFSSWENGFKAWYQLICNLYVTDWGLVTVDQIIPKYAPAADHNDEKAYINALKYALDTWHAGILTP